MKTSVVVCTYNGADTIIEQLESIRVQTRQVDEVIICDDRSSDDTVSTINNYIRNYNLEGWNVFVNEVNRGYGANFYHGARRAHGEYILFCDQDDIWMPDRVDRIIQQMDNNDQILVLGSEFEPFTVGEGALEVPAWELATFKNDDSIEPLAFNAGNIFIGCQGCTMCVRKSFWDSIEEYWFDGWAHDEFVWKLALVKGGLYFYHYKSLKRRVHAGNVSLHKMRDVKKRIQFLENLVKSHEATLKYSLDIGEDKKQKELLEKNIEATRLRIGLMQNRKYFNVFPLVLKYMDCFHKKGLYQLSYIWQSNNKGIYGKRN